MDHARSLADRLIGQIKRLDPRAGLLIGVFAASFVGVAVATAWGPDSNVAAQPANASTGDITWLAIFAVAQAAAFGLYLVALLIIRHRPPRLAGVLVLAVVIQLAPLAAPLMLSTDAWGYWNFANVSVENGGNPYVDPQSRFPDDPSYRYTNPQWRSNTTPYGPAFTLPSEVVAATVGANAEAIAMVYKVLAAAGMIALTLLVSRMATFGVFAAAFVGWNPVFAMHFGGSGHNEVLMVLLLVAAVGLARSGYARSSGIVWAISALVKWTSLVVVPLQILEDRSRGRRSLLPWLLASAVILAVIATLVYGPTWMAHPLSATGDATSRLSLSIWPRLPSVIPGTLRLLVPIAAFVIAYLWLMRLAWRGRARTGLASVLFLLASPYLWTWYLITPAALSAVDDDVPAMWLTLGMVAYAGLLYLGNAGSVFRVFGEVILG